jgi:transposase
MRYAQGGGLTAEEQERREQVRLRAVGMFEKRLPTAQIAAELRVTPRSVCRWRRAWLAGGPAGVTSRPAAQCRLNGTQLAWLEDKLRAGPLAAGYRDQRWTLARIRDLITAEYGVGYTLAGCGTCCAATAGHARWARAARPSATTRAWRSGRPGPGAR